MYWLSIGAAFEHADGKGYNVILQALPIDGKLVLRVPKSDEEDNRPPPRRDNAILATMRRKASARMK